MLLRLVCISPCTTASAIGKMGASSDTAENYTMPSQQSWPKLGSQVFGVHCFTQQYAHASLFMLFLF